MKTANINLQNEVDERCKTCFLNLYKRLFEKFKFRKVQRKKFITFFEETIDKQRYLSSPEIQWELNNEFCRIIEIDDPFKEEKADSNYIALELYKQWKPKVFSSAHPFDPALKLAIAGNIMDYGAKGNFDIQATIDTVLQASFAIDHSKLLENKINKAKRILYLGDNAGEIVFDKLFIETSMYGKVIYSVRGGYVLNDVTMEDANAVGMDLIAEVISNGSDAPSTILSHCSNEFLEIYHSADLIISKGLGNLEGLLGEKDSRIFFLLMVKCDVIAEILHVKKGSFVVYNQT
jgi:hypothetical protein